MCKNENIDLCIWKPNRQQLADLFDRDIKTIGKHINNALKEELKDVPTVAKFATVQKEGERKVSRNIEYYNLDMILSIWYRVKSNKGIIFRQWANKILKDYMLKGYVINQKRLDYLEKTIKLLVGRTLKWVLLFCSYLLLRKTLINVTNNWFQSFISFNCKKRTFFVKS